MTYKATGKPPGRPRKDGLPAGTKPAPEPLPRHELAHIVGQEIPFTMAQPCPACHPDGWPAGWTGYGCPHGIWARRV